MRTGARVPYTYRLVKAIPALEAAGMFANVREIAMLVCRPSYRSGKTKTSEKMQDTAGVYKTWVNTRTRMAASKYRTGKGGTDQ